MKYRNCRTENDFKREWIKRNRECFKDIFCIETEETEKGFPDVIGIDHTHRAYFYEFKKANKGYVKFQPSQIAFYKKHTGIYIWVKILVEVNGVYYCKTVSAANIIDSLKDTSLRFNVKSSWIFCEDEADEEELEALERNNVKI